MEKTFSPNIQQLNTNRKKVGTELIHFKRIDSTNSYLMKSPELLERNGLVVYTDYQTAGRGRMKRVWHPGNQCRHLFCSLVIHPELDPELIPCMTLLVGLAVFRVLKKLGVKDAAIKWPNDLLVKDRKLCGILCEMKVLSSGKISIVAGIGMNIEGNKEQFPEELRNILITLEEASGKKHLAEDVMTLILDQAEAVLAEARLNLSDLIAEWEKNSNSIGRKVSYEDFGVIKEGVIKGLNSNGRLLVTNEKQEDILISSGEIIYKV